MNKQLLRRVAVSAILSLSTFAPLSHNVLLADNQVPAANQTDVKQLEADAFRALRTGDFDTSGKLLTQASRLNADPELAKMVHWTTEFEDQLKVFAGERHTAYDKAVADVQLLVKNGHEDFALDFATRAQLLADNKKTFRAEPWVQGLVDVCTARAEQYEKSQDWLKAMRIYSDLTSIDPAEAKWKEKFKLVTRRVRLLAMYAPDELKSVQERETKERDEVTALVHPTTQPLSPTTKPTENVNNENFRVDWHETLRNVKMSMLSTAMHEAAVSYYRDVSYRGLMNGGLKGLRAVVTTPGLEKAFPNLADPVKADAFRQYLDRCNDAAQAATPATEQGLMDSLLSASDKDGILAANAQTLQLPEEVIVAEFADGALAGLDPFTAMIWPSEQDEFNKTTQGEFSGVGIQIQLDDEGNLKVVSPLEDSPAYKSGIKADDLIAQINGKSAKHIVLTQAVKTITGPAGTTVTLTVRSPDGVVKDHVLRRETIKVASVKGYKHKAGGGWDYFLDHDNRIGYLRITNFTKGTGDELAKALEEMNADAGVRGLVLDLRGNPGGLLSAAADVADRFLKNGVIVSTHPDRETPNQATVMTAHDDGDEYDKPLVVLVNQYSASASEIVSGALKDDHRALIIGERSFGKGSVQMLFPLSGRTASLKLTTSHYYLPNGKCIHREENSTEWGVEPNVRVELTPEQMRAVQDARQEMDILRDATPAQGGDPALKVTGPELNNVAANTTGAGTTTQPTTKRDLLTADPQLAAALLVLRMEVVGGDAAVASR